MLRLAEWDRRLAGALVLASICGAGCAPEQQPEAARTALLPPPTRAPLAAELPRPSFPDPPEVAPLRMVETRLLARDAGPYSHFGAAVALDGDTAVVGAPHDSSAGIEAGAVYVFDATPRGWLAVAKLVPGDAAPLDGCGSALAIEADRVVVGCDGHDHLGRDAGAVFVFERRNGGWREIAELTLAEIEAGDRFGRSVAAADGRVVIGAPGDDDGGSGAGATYVFGRGRRGWTIQAKLTARDAAEHDGFGTAVAASGDAVLVGAYGDDDRGSFTGAAYVFRRGPDAWMQEAKLLPRDAAPLDEVGASVALRDDLALIGAPHASARGGRGAGRATVFRHSAAGWAEWVPLESPESAEGDGLGHAVALCAGSVLVGVHFDDDHGAGSGSAYLFVPSGERWVPAKLTASDARSNHEFGVAVACSRGRLLVGSMRAGEQDDAAGAAYVFEPPPVSAEATAPQEEAGS